MATFIVHMAQCHQARLTHTMERKVHPHNISLGPQWKGQSNSNLNLLSPCSGKLMIIKGGCPESFLIIKHRYTYSFPVNDSRRMSAPHLLGRWWATWLNTTRRVHFQSLTTILHHNNEESEKHSVHMQTCFRLYFRKFFAQYALCEHRRRAESNVEECAKECLHKVL